MENAVISVFIRYGRGTYRLPACFSGPEFSLMATCKWKKVVQLSVLEEDKIGVGNIYPFSLCHQKMMAKFQNFEISILSFHINDWPVNDFFFLRRVWAHFIKTPRNTTYSLKEQEYNVLLTSSFDKYSCSAYDMPDTIIVGSQNTPL